MKKIEMEDLKNYYNGDISILNDEDLKIYSLYYSLLIDYLLKNSNLKKVDEDIYKCDLNFVPVKIDNMDLFQYMSSENLKYFYIRNIIHVERLTKEEKEFLLSKNNLDLNDNEELESFVKNSMYKLIYEGKGKENETVFYGPFNANYMLPANSLVIGFRYDEFNNDGMSDNEWDINHDKQDNKKLDFFREINIKNDKFKDVLVRFLEYNDFSIQKKNNVDNMTIKRV
ncbi:MAG: hypothetical protein IKE73_03835 [Bacilli bacterium]|nr:hypothetical protein [Bacilli bacterium]